MSCPPSEERCFDHAVPGSRDADVRIVMLAGYFGFVTRTLSIRLR
jgi:hypothetical protein